MEKITVENFNDSMGEKILDRLVESDAIKYSVLDNYGDSSTIFKEKSAYAQALPSLFWDEILNKLDEQELLLFFNYENKRYEAACEKEDEKSKYVSMASDDMRYVFADKINEIQQPNSKVIDLNSTVEELSAKSK